MAVPFTKTLQVLTASQSPEAVDLLVLALESGCETVAVPAAGALLERNGLQGQREILKRFSQLPAALQQSMQARAERFDALLRQLLIQGAPEQRQEGLAAVRALHAAEQIPQLIQLLCRDDVPDLGAVTECLTDLIGLLDDDVRSTSVTDTARNAVTSRRDRALVHLEQALSKYESLVAKDVVIESILILGPAQHAAVKKVLWQASPECRDRAGKMLLTSQHPKIMRQVIDSLKQGYPHPKAFEAVKTRTDIEFLCELLRAVTGKTSPMFDQNLKQIEKFDWLESTDPPFALIPPVLQPALLTLVFATKVAEERKAQTQDWLLRHGGPAGRMAAAERVALLDENVIQDVLVNSLDAEDEHVQAWAVTQLRQHAVPEAFALLLERLDSPLAEVRAAARNELSDFNLERALGIMDSLDASTALRVGELLRKVDEQACAKLERELHSAMRPKRVQAARAIVKLGFQRLLLTPLLALVTDGDLMIRRTLAEILDSVLEPEVLPVLDRLAQDSHPRVRETAARALAVWQQKSVQQIDPVLVQ